MGLRLHIQTPVDGLICVSLQPMCKIGNQQLDNNSDAVQAEKA